MLELTGFDFDSKKEKRIVKEYMSGEKIRTILDKEDIYDRSLYDILDKYGVERRSEVIKDIDIPDRYPDDLVSKLIVLYRDIRVPVSEIRDYLGISAKNMYNILNSMGVKKRREKGVMTTRDIKISIIEGNGSSEKVSKTKIVVYDMDGKEMTIDIGDEKERGGDNKVIEKIDDLKEIRGIGDMTVEALKLEGLSGSKEDGGTDINTLTSKEIEKRLANIKEVNPYFNDGTAYAGIMVKKANAKPEVIINEKDFILKGEFNKGVESYDVMSENKKSSAQREIERRWNEIDKPFKISLELLASTVIGMRQMKDFKRLISDLVNYNLFDAERFKRITYILDILNKIKKGDVNMENRKGRDISMEIKNNLDITGREGRELYAFKNKWNSLIPLEFNFSDINVNVDEYNIFKTFVSNLEMGEKTNQEQLETAFNVLEEIAYTKSVKEKEEQDEYYDPYRQENEEDMERLREFKREKAINDRGRDRSSRRGYRRGEPRKVMNKERSFFDRETIKDSRRNLTLPSFIDREENHNKIQEKLNRHMRSLLRDQLDWSDMVDFINQVKRTLTYADSAYPVRDKIMFDILLDMIEDLNR